METTLRWWPGPGSGSPLGGNAWNKACWDRAGADCLFCEGGKTIALRAAPDAAVIFRGAARLLRAVREQTKSLRLDNNGTRSNAQCEQFNHADPDHQHGECYRIIVEPILPWVHDTPPLFPLISRARRQTVQMCRGIDNRGVTPAHLPNPIAEDRKRDLIQ
jgi:hypothetical protein